MEYALKHGLQFTGKHLASIWIVYHPCTSLLLLVVPFPWEINDSFDIHKRIRQLSPHQPGRVSPITKLNLCYYLIKYHPSVLSSFRSSFCPSPMAQREGQHNIWRSGWPVPAI